jgi:hypothetical protein
VKKMIKSQKKYELASKMSLVEIRDILNANTLEKQYLTMEHTSKSFIGRVRDNDFSLIHSWFPIGAACVLNGRIEEKDGISLIHITASLHRVAMILFYSWIVIMGGLFFITETIGQNTFNQIILLLVAAVFFRTFLHQAYVIARNKAITRLRDLVAQSEHSTTRPS